MTMRALHLHILAVGISVFAACVANGADNFSARSNEWQTVPLLKNDAVAARLVVRRAASSADQDWIIIELENLAAKPLGISQAWLNLDGDCYDAGKLICSSGLTPGNIFHGSITSGVVRIGPEVCNIASLNLGPPPPQSLRVEAKARLSLSLGDGRNCDSSAVSFSFTWHPPNTSGIAAMKSRLLQLLPKPEYKFAHGYQMALLLNQPEVAAGITAGELLAALKIRQNSVDGRDRIAQELGKRFARDTAVVAYVVDRLKSGQVEDTFRIWNSAFVPPLIEHFEKTGDSIVLGNVLAQHTSDWSADPALVSRVSKALLKHRPLLSTNIVELPASMLYQWAVCAHEAALTGDKSMVSRLSPALDDQRLAIHPHENQMANRIPRQRVCDQAYLAIARLLGIEISSDLLMPEDNNRAAFDHAIAELKKRLIAR